VAVNLVFKETVFKVTGSSCHYCNNLQKHVKNWLF